MINKKKIYSVIVTFNGEKWIRKCLESLLCSTFETNIVVIDNCSSDNTVKIISDLYPNLKIIENEINIGFGQANNIGISYAINNQADFIFLLNQDAFVQLHTLEKLVNLAVQNPDYGIISPVQLNYDGDNLEKYFKTFIKQDAAVALFSDIALNRKVQNIYKTQFIQAAIWLIPVKVFLTVGGFDPIFFHYGEDNNFCQRVEYHKFKIGVAIDVKANHYGSEVIDIFVVKFSEKYFLDLEKKMKCQYADLNINLTNANIKVVKRKILRLFLKSILKLQIKNSVGFYKEFKMTTLIFESIIKSRKQNEIVGSHYLSIS